MARKRRKETPVVNDANREQEVRDNLKEAQANLQAARVLPAAIRSLKAGELRVVTLQEIKRPV